MAISIKIDAGDSLAKIDRELKARLKEFAAGIADAVGGEPVDAVAKLAGIVADLEVMFKRALSLEKQLEQTTGSITKELGSLRTAGLDEGSAQIAGAAEKLAAYRQGWVDVKQVVTEAASQIKQASAALKSRASELTPEQVASVGKFSGQVGTRAETTVAKAEARFQAQTSTVRSAFVDEGVKQAEKQRQAELDQVAKESASAAKVRDAEKSAAQKAQNQREAAWNAKDEAEADAANKARIESEKAFQQRKQADEARVQAERDAAWRQHDAQKLAEAKAESTDLKADEKAFQQGKKEIADRERATAQLRAEAEKQRQAELDQVAKESASAAKVRDAEKSAAQKAQNQREAAWNAKDEAEADAANKARIESEKAFQQRKQADEARVQAERDAAWRQHDAQKLAEAKAESTDLKADEKAFQQGKKEIADRERAAAQLRTEAAARRRRDDDDLNRRARELAQSGTRDLKKAASVDAGTNTLQLQAQSLERQVAEIERTAASEQEAAEATADLRAQIEALNQAMATSSDVFDEAIRRRNDSDDQLRELVTQNQDQITTETRQFIAEQRREQQQALNQIDKGRAVTQAKSTSQAITVGQRTAVEDQQRRDQEAAEANRRARELAQTAARETRMASSNLESQESARREQRDLQQKIRNAREVAETDAEAAAAVVEMERRVRELGQTIEDNSLAFEQATVRAEAAWGELNQALSSDSRITDETRRFAAQQDLERGKATRKIDQREVTAEGRAAAEDLKQRQNVSTDANDRILEAQRTARTENARASALLTQHKQLSVTRADLEHYIAQLDKVRDKTGAQQLQLANWRAELEQVTRRQRDLGVAAEESSARAVAATQHARQVLGEETGRGALTGRQQNRAEQQQGRIEDQTLHLAMKTISSDARAAAESLSITGRFMTALGNAGKTTQKVLVDMAQAYFINTRAGNEAFNAAQRAERMFAGSRFATFASTAVVGVIGAIATYQAAAKADEMRQKSLRSSAASGDSRSLAELNRIEGSALAAAGATRQLNEEIFRGTDKTGLFGSTIRGLASGMESLRQGVRDVTISVSEEVSQFDKAGMAAARLNAELRERRALLNEQVFAKRIEVRGQIGSAGVSGIKDQDVLDAERQRLRNEISSTKDGKLITEVLGPRLIALEGQLVSVRQAQLDRTRSITSEVAKATDSTSVLKGNIAELLKYLRTASGPDADKAIQSLTLYRDRLREIELQAVAMQQANLAAWRGLPSTLIQRRIGQSPDTATANSAVDEARQQEDTDRKAFERLQRQAARQQQLAIRNAGLAGNDATEREAKALAEAARQAEAIYDLSRKARVEAEYAAQAQERNFRSRRQDAQQNERNAAEQQKVDLFRTNLQTVRDPQQLNAIGQGISSHLTNAASGSAYEKRLLEELAAVKARERQLELEAAERRVAAERLLFDLTLRRSVALQEQAREQERLFSLVGIQEAVGRASGRSLDGNAAGIEQARKDRISELESRRPALDTKIQQAAANGVSAEQLAQLQSEMQAIESEIAGLQTAIVQDSARRAQDAAQKAAQIKVFTTGGDKPFKADQFDEAEKRLAMFAASENLSIERKKAAAKLQADMQKSLDEASDTAKDLAAKIADLEKNGQGATDAAVKLRQEMERQLGLATDIAQRARQIAEAEKEAAFAARAKEQTKRNEAASKATDQLRQQGQLDPLSALGQRIDPRMVQRQVQEDRKAKFEELRKEVGDAEARKRVFGKPAGLGEQVEAKQRLGQAAIDNLENRGLISEEMATQLREQLNAEAEKVKESVRLREALDALRQTVVQVNKLPQNIAPEKGANPNAQKGLLNAEKPLNEMQKKALAEQKAAQDRQKAAQDRMKQLNEQKRQKFLASPAGKKWLADQQAKKTQAKKDSEAFIKSGGKVKPSGPSKPAATPSAGKGMSPAMKAAQKYADDRRKERLKSQQPVTPVKAAKSVEQQREERWAREATEAIRRQQRNEEEFLRSLKEWVNLQKDRERSKEPPAFIDFPGASPNEPPMPEGKKPPESFRGQGGSIAREQDRDRSSRNAQDWENERQSFIRRQQAERIEREQRKAQAEEDRLNESQQSQEWLDKQTDTPRFGRGDNPQASNTPSKPANPAAAFMQGVIKLANQMAESQAKLAEDSQRANQFIEALSQQVAALTGTALQNNESARNRAARSLQNV